MSNPLPYLLRMVVFLIAVAGLAFVLHQDLIRIFLHTPILDGVILAVLLLGIVVVFRQVILLQPEVRWVQAFKRRKEDDPLPDHRAANLLAPMAAMLGERQGRLRLSATAARALLDGIASRLDERRELARYMIGLLIFLGLLGTFWGLLETIGSVADAISNLRVTPGTDPLQMFGTLQQSIQGPLQGMATAFGASLFGLSGSLVLGFLELQASQAQGRFHIELEEWLSGAASLGSPGLPNEGLAGGAAPAYVEALLERNAESVDGLVRALQRIETSRQATISSYATLVERLAALAETVRTQQTLLARFTELAIELRGSVNRLSERAAAAEDQVPQAIAESERKQAKGLEELQASVNRLIEDNTKSRNELAQEVRDSLAKLADRLPDADRETVAAHQRTIESQLARMVDETGRDRAALADELRGEIRLLARSVALSRAPSEPFAAPPIQPVAED